MKAIGTVFSLMIAAPAGAQLASPCDWQARADAIVEPWEENTVTFAGGAVRVAHLDVAEPAAAAAYLLVLHPPADAVLGRTCTVIGQGEGLGYAGIQFDVLDASYDPATGLTLTVPARIQLPDQTSRNTVLLNVQINQSTGDVVVTQELANE